MNIGQIWKTKSGKTVTVVFKKEDSCKPWAVKNGPEEYFVGDDGKFLDSGAPHPYDLVEIVSFDAEQLATETLEALGWRFDGQTWVDERIPTDAECHPLYSVFMRAIDQAMYGKGERHGGAQTPFTDQPWVHYARMHGRGFLTGQAAKKLEEAASKREGAAFETEVLGAIVYAGMSILKERGQA